MLTAEMEKPAAWRATGFQMIDMLPGRIDDLDDTQIGRLLQANGIRQQFDLSWPLARCVAEHVYGRAHA